MFVYLIYYMVYLNVINMKDYNLNLFDEVKNEKQVKFHKLITELDFCIACGEVYPPQENLKLCPDCFAECYPGVKLAWQFERDELPK